MSEAETFAAYARAKTDQVKALIDEEALSKPATMATLAEMHNCGDLLMATAEAGALARVASPALEQLFAVALKAMLERYQLILERSLRTLDGEGT